MWSSKLLISFLTYNFFYLFVYFYNQYLAMYVRVNLDWRAGERVGLRQPMTYICSDLKERANFSEAIHYLKYMEIWSAVLVFPEYRLLDGAKRTRLKVKVHVQQVILRSADPIDGVVQSFLPVLPALGK